MKKNHQDAPHTRKPASRPVDKTSTPPLAVGAVPGRILSPGGTTRSWQQATILQLQKQRGNAFVQRWLAGQMLQRVALTDDDLTAIANQLHNAMAGWGTDEEAIFAGLQKLKKDATAITGLKDKYKDKYKSTLEADLRSEMSGSELAFALELINIKEDTSAKDIVGTQPAGDEEYKTAAAKLNAAMKGLGTDEEAIYGVLLPFNRDAVKLKKLAEVYNTELSGGLTGKGLEADLKDEMSGEELAYALYLLKAPPPETGTHTQANVEDAGTEGANEAVEGGTATAHTDVKYRPPGGGGLRDEGFSLEYKGGLAAESRWLQFIWREIVVTHPTKGEYRLEDSVTTTGGTYDLTTDPANPNYNTDSNNPDSPFYEAGFRSNRTADSTSIYDQPGAISSKVYAEIDKGATKVISRAHFDTFLIRDHRPLFHANINVAWEFTEKSIPPRTQSTDKSGKVSKLPAGMKKRLVEQYPQYDYIL